MDLTAWMKQGEGLLTRQEEHGQRHRGGDESGRPFDTVPKHWSLLLPLLFLDFSVF